MSCSNKIDCCTGKQCNDSRVTECSIQVTGDSLNDNTGDKSRDQLTTSTTKLCLGCNNDVDKVVESFKANPHIINIQCGDEAELTLVIHDKSINGEQLIQLIRAAGYDACFAPTISKCYIKASIDKKVVDLALGQDKSNDCCKSSSADAEASNCSSEVSSSAESSYWLNVCMLLCVVTVCWNVTEGIVSIIYGSKDSSIALWEFGSD
jgi:hypothetical protein